MQLQINDGGSKVTKRPNLIFRVYWVSCPIKDSVEFFDNEPIKPIKKLMFEIYRYSFLPFEERKRETRIVKYPCS